MGLSAESLIGSGIEGTESKSLSGSANVHAKVESCFYDADDTLMENLWE